MDRENDNADGSNSPQNRSYRQVMRVVIAVLPALLFSAFAFQLWYHATRTSPVIDEPAHILAGYRYWECSDYGINPEHPPLTKLLATAPLLRRDFAVPDIGCGKQITAKVLGFVQGNMFLVQNGVDGIVVPARLAAALITLFLAVLVFLAAREMFGSWAGVVALAILAFDSNFIAHGSIVTTDMAITSTAFAAVYAIYRYGNKRTGPRFLIAAAAVGLMLASKHSALFFIPVLFALALADVLIFRKGEGSIVKMAGQRTASFGAWVIIGVTILWAFYGFRYYSLPGPNAATVSLQQYAKENGRPETIDSRTMKIVQTIGGLGVLPESYMVGLTDITAANSRDAFILNRFYTTGQWWYFPLVFVVKSSVALLVLLPTGLFALAFGREKYRESMFLLVPAIVYFSISLTFGFNSGVRHLLPVYPFFIVAAAGGSVGLCRRFSAVRYGLVAILLFHAMTPFRIAPYYMAFSNDFAGGLNETYNYSRDANVDYGQALRLPAEYVEQSNIDPDKCWFAAPGNFVMVKAMQPCHVLPSRMTRLFGEMMMDPLPTVIEGTIFVSANELPPRGGPEHESFVRSVPIKMLGGAVFVYQGRFEIPIAAAISHVNRAAAFARSNQLDEAAAEARSAIKISPADPRTHASLANILFLNGQNAEAQAEFETALDLAKADPAFFTNLTVAVRKQLARLNDQ